MKSIRNYGSVNKYIHKDLGVNSRLDEIQASVLLVKLKFLDQLNAQRKLIAQTYNTRIYSDSILLPQFNDYHVWHLYVIRVEDRNRFVEHMKKNGIETLIHYPIPPHLSDAYQKIKLQYYLPITEKIAKQVVSLPIYPGLSVNAINHVINTCNEYKI